MTSAAERAYHKNLRAARVAAGLCVQCGKAASEPDARQCRPCADRRAAQKRVRWARHASTTAGRVASLLYQAKNSAREKGVPFDLDLGLLMSLAVAECPVLGVRIDYGLKGSRTAASPSVDRVIPALGYVRGNVRIISWRANRLKSDGTPDELLRVAEYARRAEGEVKSLREVA